MARELWTCPKCGRKLYVRNQEHTCGLCDLESHFDGKDPIGRHAFDWICDLLDPLGEYDILPMKSMIAFAMPSNIAFLKTKKNGAEISFVMSRPLTATRIVAGVAYSKVKTIYRVKIVNTSELDPELRDWILEAAGKKPAAS